MTTTRGNGTQDSGRATTSNIFTLVHDNDYSDNNNWLESITVVEI